MSPVRTRPSIRVLARWLKPPVQIFSRSYGASRSRVRAGILIGILALNLVSLVWMGRVWASADPAAIRVRTAIPAQEVGTALQAFAKARGLQIVYVWDEVRGVRTRGVNGEFTMEEALKRLLDGTGLTFLYLSENAVTIVPIRRPQGANVREPDIDVAIMGVSRQLEQLAGLGIGSLRATDFAPERPSADEAQRRDLLGMEEVLVTGSNIRNVTDQFSPVRRVTREAFDRSGFADVSDFIERLPQNFGGGTFATPDRGAGSLNGVGASTVNLRAMGAGATLALLNGRRIAPSGTAGAYVDISGIPTSALDRVEVLTDGASAIYGSDAIAGVINIILRRDYNGAETRMRVGTKGEGDANDYQIGQTFGISNERGRALVSYEYSSEQPLDANDRSYTAMMEDPNDILPGGNRHAAFFSGGLNLGAGLELFMDANYSDRHSRQHTKFNETYRLTIADVENWGGALGLAARLGGDWRAEVSASASVTDFKNIEFERPTRENFGGSDMWNDESVWSVDAKADGPLFDWRGGTVRAVVGAQYREESHDGATDFFDEFGAPLNQIQLAADNDRQVSALYTEIYAPLVSEKNDVRAVRSLALSLAGRYEHYSDFGRAFNPKFGVLWSPVEGLALRGSYGKSFRAPPMFQLVDGISYVSFLDYIDPEVPTGRSVAALVVGDTRDLDAEKSTSWSVGIDLRPTFAPELNARVTYYDIEYSGRIAYPAPQINIDTYEFYDFPLPLDRNPDLDQIQRWIDQSDFGLLINYTELAPTGSQSTLEDVTVLMRGFYTNTAASRAAGIDADLSYELSRGDSRLTAALYGNYILESEDQFSPVRPATKTFDRMFYPARLRMRGGVMWSLGAFSANMFANYVSSYEDSRALNAPATKVDSWLTFDASLQYDFDRAGAGRLISGTKLTLSVLNILDESPPRVAFGIHVTESNYVAYDTANADPDGRTIALQLTKQW